MPKLSWRSLLMDCCGRIDDDRKPSPSSAGRDVKPNSPRRLSLSNVSNSAYPMSPENLSLTLAGSNLHVFTLAELKAVTGNFSTSNFIGEGGFGPVHKGFIDGTLWPGLKAQIVAVKRLDLEGLQGHNEWLAEVIFLGQLQHQHLVKLIGYCYEDEHRLLVYEFMDCGSLENHLFKSELASSGLLAPLPWSTRLKIAVGAAKGLAFLHEAEMPVIYRDFKASNILLDSDYNAKLSDFGLAKEGPEGDESHVSTRVMGTHGYAAPDYVLTGHLTAKSDVYSFGVVLLELLTGKRSIDKTRPSRQQDMVEWARPCLKNREKLSSIMDPSLDGQYSTKGAQKAAAVAHQCLSQYPKSRPQMRAVVETLEPLQELGDAPTGPLFYMATVEVERDEDNSQKEAKQARHAQKKMLTMEPKESGLRHCRNKLGRPKSAIHSDTALYRSSPGPGNHRSPSTGGGGV